MAIVLFRGGAGTFVITRKWLNDKALISSLSPELNDSRCVDVAALKTLALSAITKSTKVFISKFDYSMAIGVVDSVKQSRMKLVLVKGIEESVSNYVITIRDAKKQLHTGSLLC